MNVQRVFIVDVDRLCQGGQEFKLTFGEFTQSFRGGQLLFETIEAVIRRPIPEVIRVGINLVSWVLILGVIVFLSYQDILGLIFG